jgi:hypothetical protein
MLAQVNMRCRVAATALTLVPVAAAAGQTEPSMPESEAAVTAYYSVRQWLDEYDLPDPDDQAALVPIGDAAGVCVIVRRSGRVLASADATGDDSSRLTWQAAGRAFTSLQGGQMGELPEMLHVEAARSLTLEVEVAGPLEPMLGRSLRDVGQRLEPGLDGVALRVGDQLATEFPSALRARNAASATGQVVVTLANELGVRELDGILERPDVQLYRFRTIHLVQREIGAAPFRAFRGQEIVPDSAVTTQSIRDATDRLAEHIIRALPHRPVPEEGKRTPRLGLKGSYDPITDSFEPLVARPLEQALLSLALARYANVPGAEHADAARQLAMQTIQELAAVELVEQNPLEDEVACAAVVLAVIEMPGVEGDPAVGAMFGASVESVTGALGAAGPRVLRPHGRALIAAAVSRLLRVRAIPRDQVRSVRDAIDSTWAATPEPNQIGLLPWIGWAELDYGRATGSMVGADKLRLLRALIERTRVGYDGPQDVRGGFAFVGRDGSRSRPTAQSLRPAAFMAAMLREPSLTGAHESGVALGQHLRTVRYVMQLMVRPECLWALRNPDEALGGIRAATWERSQPAAAQALGLLTLSETVLSLAAPADANP